MRRVGVGCEGTRLTRLRRRLGLEHNELRRRIDHVQRLIGFGLLLLLLGVAPPLAAWTASLSYQAGVRAEQQEQATRRQATATVTETGRAGSSVDGYVHETVRATWRGPDGRAHTGTLPGWRNARVGEQRTIWIDEQGDPAVPPRPHSRTVTDAGYAAAATVLGSALPIVLGYGFVRRRCDRRRERMWEAEWARLNAAGHNRS